MRLASPSEQDERNSCPRKKCKIDCVLRPTFGHPCGGGKALDRRVVANYVRVLEYVLPKNEKSASRRRRRKRFTLSPRFRQYIVGVTSAGSRTCHRRSRPNHRRRERSPNAFSPRDKDFLEDCANLTLALWTKAPNNPNKRARPRSDSLANSRHLLCNLGNRPHILVTAVHSRLS